MGEDDEKILNYIKNNNENYNLLEMTYHIGAIISVLLANNIVSEEEYTKIREKVKEELDKNLIEKFKKEMENND